MTCAVHSTNLPKGAGVRVNGIQIPRDAIAREVQNHPSRTPTEAWTAAARSLVIRELLLQEARKIGIEAVPQTDDSGRRETEEEALVRGVVDSEVTTPEPDTEVCRRYYEQNKKAFRSPAIFEVAHILFCGVPGRHESLRTCTTKGLHRARRGNSPSKFFQRYGEISFRLSVRGDRRQPRSNHERRDNARI